MLGDMIPFCIAGNLYFVGEYRASSHMIDTGEGLILLDAGYEETADIIIESLETLGYSVKDVNYIILSHGHGDHSDGAPKLKALSGAQILMGEEDVKYLKGFTPDAFLQDGQVISLGNTAIRCVKTPGHTEGTFSFFWDVEADGKVYCAGMFGGAGTNQLKKDYMNLRRPDANIPYIMRGEFFKSVARLRQEHVDLFVGNHPWNNNTKENYEKSLTSEENPFIDDTRWGAFLDKAEQNLEEIIRTESRTHFVNYAHRGASEYLPENTFLAFYTGIYMGANGIETDVHLTKDGIPVLFHDDTLERITGEAGAIEDYTYEELQAFDVKKDGFHDKIVKLEDFLGRFCHQDLHFAIELKGANAEKQVADLIRKYGLTKDRVMVTSFKIDFIRNIKAYAPELRVGYLAKEITDELLEELKSFKADELCPRATDVTPESVHRWHREGFNVRAWGLANKDLMRQVYDAGADGMTVNFPDKLTAYIQQKAEV